MKLDGEIILIDNDKFENDFLQEIVRKLNYDVPIVFFQTAMDGYTYLKSTTKDIFLIISEIEFDKMTGLDLKKKINEEANTRWKSSPFIFVVNHVTKSIIDEAFKLGIHGIFQKPRKLDELVELYSVIIKYWISNLHPNKSELFYNLRNDYSK